MHFARSPILDHTSRYSRLTYAKNLAPVSDRVYVVLESYRWLYSLGMLRLKQVKIAEASQLLSDVKINVSPTHRIIIPRL
jgi:hypothetical protein